MDLSIIIPTYNRLWSLPQTIASCKNNLCNTEIIVIDDGSTDGTWEWLLQQENIICIKQQNWGKCWAVNKGFEVAKGKYIRFLDSDDMLDKNAADEQFKLAEQENTDVVVSGYKVIDQNNAILKEQKWPICDDFIAQQLGECDASHYCAYLFKKDFITAIPHRPDFAFRDDRLFVLELALKNPKISVHEGTALLHRSHENNRLQFNNGTLQIIQNNQHLKLYQLIINQLLVTNQLTQRRKNAATNILWPLAHWIAIYHLKEATAVANWIFELNPDFKIPQRGFLGFLYKNLGFKRTEKILKFRRFLIKGIQ